MTRPALILPALAVLALALPGAALAQDATAETQEAAPTEGTGAETPVGTVTGTFLDEEVSFTATEYEAEGAGGSLWQEIPEGRAVALVASPEDADQPEMTIEFRLPADGTEVSAQAVTYTDGDVILVAGEEAATITIETAETEGDTLTVAGTVTAELAEDASTGIVISEDETQTFDGRFEATLTRAE